MIVFSTISQSGASQTVKGWKTIVQDAVSNNEPRLGVPWFKTRLQLLNKNVREVRKY